MRSTAAVPAFAALADAITVDVVVLDRDGRPVEDLKGSDFTILEEGRPQQIVGFEPRRLGPRSQEHLEDDDPVASNVHVGRSEGRTLLFVIDDLGIEPPQMPAVVDALTLWLSGSADPRDLVTIATSSGDAWWSDRVQEGLADLEAVLRRIRGRKLQGARGAISDWESYRIDVYGKAGDGSAASAGPPSLAGTCTSSTPPFEVLRIAWSIAGSGTARASATR